MMMMTTTIVKGLAKGSNYNGSNTIGLDGQRLIATSQKWPPDTCYAGARSFYKKKSGKVLSHVYYSQHDRSERQ